MINIIIQQWSQTSGSTLNPNTAMRFLIKAVTHVEAIDYPNTEGYTYTITDDGITFSAEPSNAMAMLYVLKSLEDIQRQEISTNVANNKLGTNWKSGMDSVNTTGATKASQALLEDYKDIYKKALNRVKINGLSYSQIGIYYDADNNAGTG